MVSPMRIAWLGLLTGSPLTVTAPDVHRREARERLLANRANQSH
jgi:hypothetical protein